MNTNSLYVATSWRVSLLCLTFVTGSLLGVSPSMGAQDPGPTGQSLAEQLPSADQSAKKETPRATQPVLPPTTDPEMVVDPPIPPDLEAVVPPPVVDPEMAIDPASRESLTPEKLQQLTPEALKNDPSHQTE